jgi:hypothetical protein
MSASGLCVIGAIVVAASGHDGWGWFLFIAFLVNQKGD